MPRPLKYYIQAFIHGRDAAVAIIVAVALPIVLSITILAIDYSMALLVRVENQRTADIAVYAAAMTYGQASGDRLDAARAEAANLLGLNGADPDDLTLNLLPEVDGRARLELLIDQDLPPIGLISLRGPEGLRVVVRSVAQVGSAIRGPECLRAVKDPQSGGGGEISLRGGAPRIALNDCDIVADGRITRNAQSPSASITGGDCIAASVDPDQMCETVSDEEPSSWPLALPASLDLDWVQENPWNPPSFCDPSFTNTLPNTLTDGAIYCIDAAGGIKPNSVIQGENVQNPQGNLIILSPRTDIEFAASGFDFKALNNNFFIYAPSSTVSFRGNAGFEGVGCGGIVANDFDIRGSVTFAFDCPGGSSGGAGGSPAGVRLLE